MPKNVLKPLTPIKRFEFKFEPADPATHYGMGSTILDKNCKEAGLSPYKIGDSPIKGYLLKGGCPY